MAEGAIGAETGLCIHACFLVYVLCVRELKENRSGALISGEGNQIPCPGGRKAGMTLRADNLLQIFIEVVTVARDALVVSGALEGDRPFLHGHVAHVAFEFAAQLLFVEGMDHEFFSGRNGGWLGQRRNDWDSNSGQDECESEREA
jgi:hypothetical protein